jgi:hypothetical protein
MKLLSTEASRWAEDEFGGAALHDRRRRDRVVQMAARVAECPGGKVSEVFKKGRELQGAYDLLEGGHVRASSLIQAMGRSAAKRSAAHEFVFVAVDGSSLTLADRTAAKDFGSLGKGENGRGLKVISALGISPEGVPLGLFSQVWWARIQPRAQTRKEKKRRYRERSVEEKETRHWLTAIEEAHERAREAGVSVHFLADRENDNREVLLKLAATGERFTVRASWDRRIVAPRARNPHLREWLSRQPPKGEYALTVPADSSGRRRTARMRVRWGSVRLRLCDPQGHDEQILEVKAVWAHEEGTCPRGEKPIDWLLLTNAAVDALEDALTVIHGYTLRWRIEEFHKTWKTGVCNVESTQLRSQQAVLIWATLLAAVAARVERLKSLARTTPDEPASIELSPHEIRALILLKRRYKKRTETIPNTMPTIGQATLWIAELGGYQRQSSGAPPGAITIQRGLNYLLPAADLLCALEMGGK